MTVSELLMGVHLADTEQRRQRHAAFVEAVIAGIGVLEFSVAVARVQAEIHAELSRQGRIIGAHDMMIAATARYHDCSLLTDNDREFAQVPDLRIIPFAP